MTVALILLDGARTAEKLHSKIAKAVFATPKARGINELERFYSDQKLHFTQMNKKQKFDAAHILCNASVSAVIGYCRHTEKSVAHDHRFEMYRELLKVTITKAFEVNEELIVSIAKQGGWESYGAGLLAELRKIPDGLSTSASFRKGDFYLASASKKGLQVADFYASSSWNHLLVGEDKDRSSAFEKIAGQVVHLQEVQLERELIKEK